MSIQDAGPGTEQAAVAPPEVTVPETSTAAAGEPQQPAGPRGRRAGSLAALVGPPAVMFVLFIGLWYAVTYVFLAEDQRFLVPAPHDIVNVAFLDPVNLKELLSGLWQTTVVAAVGLAVAVAIGFSTAVAMSQAAWVERSIFPYAVILQCIPILALVPLIGFWFDYGFFARVVVCVLISLFPIITNTLFGLQSVDAGQQDLFTLHGASRWTRLTKLQFPAALPLVFTGLRISAGLSVVGAIVGDLFFKQGENPGIGSLIGLYLSRVQQQQMYAAIILSSALGVVVFWLFGFLAKRVVGSWHVSADR